MAPIWFSRGVTGGAPLVATFCGLALVAALAFVLLNSVPVDLFRSKGASSARIALGHSVYEARCASCHGKNLEGQPNWKTRLPSGRMPAPPHDASGHSWHHPDQVLTGVTRNGPKPYAGEDYESDMPAFGGLLSDEEIDAVVSYIKSIWPERERAYQERITSQQEPQQKSP